MRFSVVISTFNRPDRLKTLLGSIYNQSKACVEIIVVEAGTIDSYKDILTFVRLDLVKVIYESGITLGAARNLGVKLAICDYILFSDDDDFWHADKIQVLDDSLEKNWTPVIYHQFMVKNSENIRNGWSHSFPKSMTEVSRIFWSNSIAGGSAFGAYVGTLRTIKFDESLRSVEDAEWWMRIAITGVEVKYVDTPLVTYNEHSSRMTSNFRKINVADISVIGKYSIICGSLFIGIILKLTRLCLRQVFSR